MCRGQGLGTAAPTRSSHGPTLLRQPVLSKASRRAAVVRNVASGLPLNHHLTHFTHAAEAGELGWRLDFERHYIKGKLLGSGSFGQVHLAVSIHSGQEVAVKTMPKVRGKLTREKTLEKITRETDFLERLQKCRGVVQLENCFEDDNSVHLVTELCSGGDLQKLVEATGPMEEKSLAFVAFEVLKIVRACHDMGILHGDVKPANFCIKHSRRNPIVSKEMSTTSVPWLKAIDFGCSQNLGTRRLSKRTGTPVFMSPEIFARDYGQPADVWSTGVMLYWMYTKRFPFFQDPEAVKASRLEDVAEAVSSAPIDYDYGPWMSMSPSGLDFIQRCLTRDQSGRMTVDEALRHPWLAAHIPEEHFAAVGQYQNISSAA